MFNLHSKFIVLENTTTKEKSVFLSRCSFHKELVDRVNDRSRNIEYKCVGGGRFKITDTIMTLEDKSQDFGVYVIDDVIDCINNKRIFDEPFLTRNIIDYRDIRNFLVYDYVSYPKEFKQINLI